MFLSDQWELTEQTGSTDENHIWYLQVNAHTRDEFLDIDIRKLENWALDRLADRTDFFGLIYRSVDEIEFEFGYRRILVKMVEVRRA